MRSMFRSLAISFSLTGVISLGASAEPGGMENRVAQLESQVEALPAALQEAQEILQFLCVETEVMGLLAGPHWIIEAANVHVRSGPGNTSDVCVNGETVAGITFPGCDAVRDVGAR